ncbi:MAG: 30S ribosomal protein S15 [Minisyncoccia bacterium]
MLKIDDKKKLIKDFQLHETDTGSADVQIAILTKEIENLAEHLKRHPKDEHSKRGLLKKIIRRKKLLKYLKKTNKERYQQISKKLKI